MYKILVMFIEIYFHCAHIYGTEHPLCLSVSQDHIGASQHTTHGVLGACGQLRPERG